MEEKNYQYKIIIHTKISKSINHRESNYVKYERKNQNIIIAKKFLFYLLFLLFLINPVFSQSKNMKYRRNLSNSDSNITNISYSEISIKINGTGNQRIIGNNDLCPDEIFINEIKVGENECMVNLANPLIVIRMLWFRNLTTCEYMFLDIDNITWIDLSKFDSSLVTSTLLMFWGCNSLISINLSNFNTSSATTMEAMFYDCYSLISLNISNFNTSLVINMMYMFYGCHSLISISLNNFNTALVTQMCNMFGGCYSLKSINLSNFNTSSVTDMAAMFGGCQSLITLDLNNFNTSLVNYMAAMFSGCYSLESLNLYNFNTSLVINMEWMFSDCTSLESLNLNNFNTSLVNDMRGMFNGCSSLITINLDKFDTSLVTYMGWMFDGCTSLKSLNLSNFNTSLVTYMGCMFSDCTSLKSLNLSNFDIHSVTYFGGMFHGSHNLEYINMEKIKEYNHSNPYDMFDYFPENIVYCINETNAPIISSFLKDKTCSINYCQDNWKEKQKKLYLINGVYVCEEQTELINEVTIINWDTNHTQEFSYKNEQEEQSELTTEITIINNDKNYTDEEYSYKNEYNEQTELTDEEITESNDTNNDENYNNKCHIEIKNINEELSFNTIERYINEYLKNNSDIMSNLLTKHYINDNINLSITIFNFWYCTNLLFEYGYFEINTNKILSIMNNSTKIANNINYIFLYINYNYKAYLEIYNYSIIFKKYTEYIYPFSFEEYDLKIKNNLTRKLNLELGSVIMNKIIEYNINPFNKEEEIFNNICKNFTIWEIDIPIKERKQLIYLGNKEKELICNDINCNIESFYLKNLSGVCNCKILNNFTYLFIKDNISTNDITEEEYNNFINSKSTINSFYIFACGKESFFLDNIKINPGFYVSIIFLIIQLVLSLLFIFMNLKNKKYKNIIKLSPPKIQKFNIDEDSEEEEEEKEKEESKKKNSYENEKNQNIKELKEDIQVKNDQNQNNSIILFNKIPLENKIDTNNPKNLDINNDKNIKIVEVNNGINSYLQKEEEFKNKIKLNPIKFNKNRRSIRNIPLNQKNIDTKENFIEPTNNQFTEEDKDTKKNIEIIQDNGEKNEKQISFWECYWEILSLKQPIINLFSPIKCLKITDTNIPFLVKLMKIIFILSLNIFFNVLHLEQKYFRNKYIYFNNKYNFIHEYLNHNIPFNERLSYGFKNAYIPGLISFLICFIIQCIINYFFFNEHIFLGKYNTHKNGFTYRNNINKNKNISEKDYKKYLLIFGIEFIIMIIIFYSIITFNEVYRGGYSDLLAATIWTFIFLQIIPFIFCLILLY